MVPRSIQAIPGEGKREVAHAFEGRGQEWKFWANLCWVQNCPTAA